MAFIKLLQNLSKTHHCFGEAKHLPSLSCLYYIPNKLHSFKHLHNLFMTTSSFSSPSLTIFPSLRNLHNNFKNKTSTTIATLDKNACQCRIGNISFKNDMTGKIEETSNL